MASISAGAERVALDLGAHRIEAVGGAAGVTVTRLPAGFGEAAEGRLGEAELVRADQTVVIGDQQRRQQRLWNCDAARRG